MIYMCIMHVHACTKQACAYTVCTCIMCIIFFYLVYNFNEKPCNGGKKLVQNKHKNNSTYTSNDKQSCKVNEFDLPSVGGQLVPE